MMRAHHAIKSAPCFKISGTSWPNTSSISGNASALLLYLNVNIFECRKPPAIPNLVKSVGYRSCKSFPCQVLFCLSCPRDPHAGVHNSLLVPHTSSSPNVSLRCTHYIVPFLWPCSFRRCYLAVMQRQFVRLGMWSRHHSCNLLSVTDQVICPDIQHTLSESL